MVNEANGGNHDIDLEEEENEAEGIETEEAPVAVELTDKDRLQQARGKSNLLEDPKFNKYLKVLLIYFSQKVKFIEN